MKRLVIVLLIAGCTTPESFDELAGRQIGMTEREIVERLGPPSSTYEVDGAKFMTWERSATSSPSYTSTLIGSTVVTTPIGGGQVRCAITYTMEPSQVIDLTAEGEPSVTAVIATDYRYEGMDAVDRSTGDGIDLGVA